MALMYSSFQIISHHFHTLTLRRIVCVGTKSDDDVMTPLVSYLFSFSQDGDHHDNGDEARKEWDDGGDVDVDDEDDDVRSQG